MDIRTSPLVRMAAGALRPTRWWAAWLLGVVFIYGGLIVGDYIGEALLGRPDRNAPLHQFVDFFGFGMILVFLFLWLRFVEQRPFSSVGLRGDNPLGRLAGGLVIGAGMMSIGVLVPWALGQYELGASVHGRLGMDAVLLLVPLLGLFILQGSTEELVLRGYMLQTAGLQIAGPAAIIGTSLMFSALHRDFDPVPFINIVLYAVFACFVALHDGSLWRICGIHAGWNYFQGNIFGLPVSGNPEGTSLWNFGPANGSNALITGGNFGVEASLIGTTVLVVALAVVMVLYRRKAADRAAAG
jgi:membrane protease YdiL (CAAX protease family)